MMRILSILMALVPVQQAWAETAQGTDATKVERHAPANGNVEPATNAEVETAFGAPEPVKDPMPAHLAPPADDPEAEVPRARWMAPEAAEAKVINEKTKEPPKVRLGLRMTPFKKVVTRGRDGTTDTRYVPGEAVRHTLRARLNKLNHFFVGEWHIESVPLKWVKKTRRYEVRLNFYRRYGAFGQLEESVGSLDLAGVLDEQPDNVHVLLGVARRRLRDNLGQPYMDVVAGFSAAAPTPVSTLSKNAPARPNAQRAPTEAPANFDAELIRGRF